MALTDLDENAEIEGKGAAQELVAGLAQELGVAIFAGTMGERPSAQDQVEQPTNSRGDKRVFNTMYVYDRSGSSIAKYRKTHLFNLVGESKESSYCEPCQSLEMNR